MRVNKPFRFIAVAVFCLLPGLLAAQVPQGIQFQAVARDASGVPMSVQAITVVFLIQNGGGTTVYSETHNLITDPFGLFEAVVGKGTPTLGTFPALDWSTNQYQVQIQVDGAPLGTCIFQSVPYALYAEKTNMAMIDLTDVDATGLLPGQVLAWNGTKWVPAAGNSQVWSKNLTNAYYSLGRVGIGIDTPKTTLHLRDTANVLFGGNLTGSGRKMIYYGAKGAFRVGYLSPPGGGINYDKFWDYDSVGLYSFAGGYSGHARGSGAFAWGGRADGSSSFAFGGSASGTQSYTFGGNSEGLRSFTVRGTATKEGGIGIYGYVDGRFGVAIGGGNLGLGMPSVRKDYGVALGSNADAHGERAVALGPSDAYGETSFSTGWITQARGNYSSTFGFRTISYPYGAMALGRYNAVAGDSASWVATDPVFVIGDGTSDANRSNSFVVLKNGRTAIGYDTPAAAMLQVSSALGTISNTPPNVTNATLLLGTPALGLAFDADQIEVLGNRLNINYSSTENLSLVFGGGSVTLGNIVAPSDRLHISTLAGENALRVQIAGTTRFRVYSNGGVSIGANTIPPDAGLYIAGQTRFDNHAFPDNDNAYTSGTAANRWQAVFAVNGTIQTSDFRDKTAIRKLEYGLEAVMALKPVKYEWKTRPQDGEKVGMIAQELQLVVPEVVYQSEEDPESRMGVNYAELVPVLVNAIQEQQAQIRQQYDEMASLRAELETLRREIRKP